MRKLILIVTVILIAFACEDANKPKKRILPESSGKINRLSVVIENELWDNTVGERLREVLAAPVDGLPQEEALFSMSQLPPQAFSDFSRHNRCIIQIKKGPASAISIQDNVYAKPQKLITISGTTIAEIKSQIKENAEQIVAVFKAEEIKEKQRRMRISLHKNNDIKARLGLSIQFPSVYRVANTIAEEKDKFFWVKRDIATGSVNFLLYELPFSAINKEEAIINQIIRIRDSIGKKYIGGPKDGTYMITEAKYTPHYFETIIDNKPTHEAKGTWEVKGVWKAGPFINYTIEDKINNRLIIAEGFIDAPSINKRDYMFELESIIKSIKTN